ncbi:MAG: hypothetical protein ACRCWL_00160, partial [Aeromonas sp.]
MNRLVVAGESAANLTLKHWQAVPSWDHPPQHEKDATMWINADPVNGALVSLAIGLIIGLERGWQLRQLGDNQR